MDNLAIGIDFGTTNSALAIATDRKQTQLTQFELFGQAQDTFRSMLYFSFDQRGPKGQPKLFAGPQAIEAYLEEEGLGRLIISPKSSLASRHFDGTQILSQRYTLERIISNIIQPVCEHASKQFGTLGTQVVAGRPVKFAGAETPEDEERALQRLRKAFELCGFEQITFEYEPVAAAYAYDVKLDHEELVLVADFGGGTTDFCIMKVGPHARTLAQEEKIIAIHGVPIAGDSLDAQVVQNIVSPELGIHSKFKSTFGTPLPMPVWPYKYLSQWHLLSMLTLPKHINTLYDIQQQSYEPRKVEAFLECVEGNLGFHLYRSVESAKIQLSSQDHCQFDFNKISDPIQKQIQRTEFEEWIAEAQREIATCCDQTLQNANLQYKDIDRVFMTGGTSFVPAIREIFVQRFGKEKIGSGHELTSVASGLAQRARELYMN